MSDPVFAYIRQGAATARKMIVHDHGNLAVTSLVGTDGEVEVISHDYWIDRVTVERMIAAEALAIDCRIGMLIMPLITFDRDGLDYEPPPLTDEHRDAGGMEELFYFTFTTDEGYSIARQQYTYRPNGEPVFDEPRMLHGETAINAHTPGFHLFTALLNPSIPPGGEA